jgi:hypothetical protein
LKDHLKDNMESKIVHCLSCDHVIKDPSEENVMGDEYLCNKCREEMLSSLEDAWKKHSAFLDSALN